MSLQKDYDLFPCSMLAQDPVNYFVSLHDGRGKAGEHSRVLVWS
jgi:hypothetical protein